MKVTSWLISASLSPTGRQMRVCRFENALIGNTRTPSLMSTSTSTFASAPSAGGPRWSPIYKAACDQVDWLKYLIAEEKRLVPSTSTTSPLRRVAAIKSRELVGRCDWLTRGFER